MRRIKVLIETNKYKHGPGTFRSRLIPALSKVDGIQVTNNIKNKFNIKSENITFMSDSEKRNNLAKKLGANVLEYNPLDLINGENIMSKQFDVVVGNPPYQKKRDPKDKKTQPIWQDFVDLSFKICKENGYICLVHPSGWRNVNGVFKKIGNKIKSKQIVYLNMNHFREGQKIFNVAIDFDWYCLKNTKNNNFLTTIKFQDNIIKDVDISNLEFIPSKMFDEVIGLIAKEGEEKVEILADSSHHTQSGLQKGFMSKKETKRFKYPCVYTVRSKNEPTFYWSSKKNGHFGIPKVIWGNGASGVIVDKKGEYSLTQYAYAIVDKVKNLKNIQKALKTEKFIKGIMGFEHSLGDKYNRRMIATFRKDFWKEFV